MSTVDQNSNHSNGREEFWRQRSWLLAAGFLATVLILSVVSFALGSDDSRSGTLQTTGAPQAQPSHARCPSGGTVGEGEPKVPEDLGWKRIGETQVPVSPSLGPQLSDRSLLRCFAHSPMGAVLAAHTITAQMSTSAWRSAVAHQVMPGFGRDIFASQRVSLPDDVRGNDTGHYEGFWVPSYSAEKAQVQLLFKGSDGFLGTTTITLQWDQGDWKIQPDVDGSLYGEVRQVDSIEGFIAWKKA
ncbi:hypothetical protein ACIQB5_48450 [Streptomyces sp. NPDC088560]|uniref:hypothetical protein n=1 Tax=Streptomyces sp. NPDC088560 TaxID=3365868 RepID=UPI0038266309